MYLSTQEIFNKLQNGEKLSFSKDDEDYAMFYVQYDKLVEVLIKESNIREYNTIEDYIDRVVYYFHRGYRPEFNYGR